MANQEIFTALADPTRRMVLETLSKGAQPVGRLAEQLPVTRPAVSQHLKVLMQAGLVTASAEGTRRIYAVRLEGLEALRRYLDSYWGDVLQSFADEMQSDVGEN